MLFDASLARSFNVNLFHPTPASSFLYTIPRSYLTSALTRLNSMQTAIKWWLDNDVFGGSRGPSCTIQSLHPSPCPNGRAKYRGCIVSRHNEVRNTFFESCRQAGVGGQKEVGSRLGHDERRTRPGDVLVPN